MGYGFLVVPNSEICINLNPEEEDGNAAYQPSHHPVLPCSTGPLHA